MDDRTSEPAFITMMRKSSSPVRKFGTLSNDDDELNNSNSNLSADLKQRQKKTKSGGGGGGGANNPARRVRCRKRKQVHMGARAELAKELDLGGSKRTADEIVDMLTNYSDHQVELQNIFKEYEKPCQIYAYLGLRHKYHPVFLNRNIMFCRSNNPNRIKREEFKMDDLVQRKSTSTVSSLRSQASPSRSTQNEVRFKIESIQLNNEADRERLNLSDGVKSRSSSNAVLEVYADAIGNCKESTLILRDVKSMSSSFDSATNSLLINKLLSVKFNSLNAYQLVLKLHFQKISQEFVAYISLSSLTTNNEDFTFKLTPVNANNAREPKSESPSKRKMKMSSVQSSLDQYLKSNLVRVKMQLVGKPASTSQAVISVKKESTEPRNVAGLVRSNSRKRAFYQFLSESVQPKSPHSDDEIVIKKSKMFKISSDCSTLTCPFCSLSRFGSIDQLLKHLKNTHFRFNFTKSIANESGAKNSSVISVSIDDLFDGSFAGNHHDLIKFAYLGFAGAYLKPTKRMSGPSNILVNRKSLDINKLAECYGSSLSKSDLEILNLIQQQLNWAQLNQINFSERIFYHSKTTQPITVKEINESMDSDDDMESDWVQEQTAMLLDEFTDVNEGEKEIMRLWNAHMLKYNLISETQIYEKCAKFIQEQGENIKNVNLTNNFFLHLSNLYEYGVISCDELISLLDSFKSKFLDDK